MEKDGHWMTESVKFPFSPNNTFPFLHRPFPKCNTYWSVLETAKAVRDCSDITISCWTELRIAWIICTNLKIKYLAYTCVRFQIFTVNKCIKILLKWSAAPNRNKPPRDLLCLHNHSPNSWHWTKCSSEKPGWKVLIFTSCIHTYIIYYNKR
jgi:hypothetical protein